MHLQNPPLRARNIRRTGGEKSSARLQVTFPFSTVDEQGRVHFRGVSSDPGTQ